ncbi:MAG: vacuolar sorting-associated 4-like [Trebouxia sp. A1-2]|nr:MAG: vacuolar sorting-associated 4-like [Trebouxia sp. A1-2]
MYGNFKERAIEYVKEAVNEDKNENYERAFELYMTALEYFKTHLKYEKNPRSKEAITLKFKEYLQRAEDIKALLNGQQPVTATPANGAQKARGPGGGPPSGDAEKDKLRASLGSAILAERPNVKWDDVAGLEAAKDALKEAVILPVKFPQFFTGKRKPWSGLLLYGPPGTGKSYLAKAVATEAESTFFTVSSSDLVSKWMGESEKLVSQLFSLAREHSPAIVFIDEIDALCSTRGEGESEAARRIKTEFLVQMQGVTSSEARVLVLGATNIPYGLDQAVRRRFDKRIYIALPEAKARAHMFKVHLGDTPHNLEAKDFEELGVATEGFSGSDVAVVVKDVLMEPVRLTQDAGFFRTVNKGGKQYLEPCSGGTPGAIETDLNKLADEGKASMVAPPSITMSMMRKVLEKARPTVSQSDLETYQKFTKEFGEEG